MPNTRETVRALVSAFNVNSYHFNTVKTNFTLQSKGKEDYIVVSFEKSMDTYQCRRYLDSIKRKMIREFYGIEESNDAEILDTAKLIFDVNSFPFNISDRDWFWDEQNGYKFVTPIDQGVIFNLKSHLAASLAKDVIEDMPTCNIRSSDRKDYLWQGEFDNKGLRKKFEREFLLRMGERYENVPKKPLKVEGNSVYIKDVFDDARFIDSVTRRAAWLIGRDLQADSKSRSDVRAFKDLIMEILDPSTRVVTSAFLCASPLNREEASILIPVILSNRGTRFLTKEEARDINHKFNNPVLDDIGDKTQATFKVNGSSGVYGIDFSNKEISHCVITKIIESSVINAKHELSIDPELRFQALSPAQSPFNSPTHAGPSGIRTPPNKRKKDTDNGYDSNSPPKPKDSVAHSPRGVPRSLFEQPQAQRSPTRSQGEELEGSPRRGSEKKQVLHNPVNLAGPSKGFQPSTQLSSSGPSSWKGANPVGANPWAQQTNPCLSQGTSENKWISSMQLIKPESSGLSWSQSGSSSWKGASERGTSDKPLTEEEKELFEALLYAFNLSNYILEYSNTNFIVKNGKIASFIDDGVDVKEYLQEIIDKTKEGYRVNKKEACDLNEFPFKFLSSCEENQEITVVANISRGALLNLKKLFIHGYEKKLEIRDIDIKNVKKTVKLRRCELVGSYVKKIEEEKGNYMTPGELVELCYPDESALEYIPIKEYETGYRLDRIYSAKEVKLFRGERWPAKDKSKAEKMKPEDNKDSGYSSGFVTDAENVSSKAEATTSGYESIDCENTRRRSPKRKSPSPEDGDSPRKSPKRDPLPLSRLESLSLSSSSHQIGKC